MGSWYAIGVCLGLGLALGVVVVGILGANVLGAGVGTVVGIAVGLGLGLLIGESEEALAAAAGAVLGAVSAAVVVTGALHRGATRFGTGAYLAAVAVLVGLVALIPIAGYLEAVLVPVLAARMRGRRAARFAGLRSLAK